MTKNDKAVLSAIVADAKAKKLLAVLTAGRDRDAAWVATAPTAESLAEGVDRLRRSYAAVEDARSVVCRAHIALQHALRGAVGAPEGD